MKGELVDRARATALMFRLAREERDSWSNWHRRDRHRLRLAASHGELAAAGAAQTSQLALFATLHDDRRPPAERTASGRYLQPGLFENKVTNKGVQDAA
jgi:hypothetical protein